MNMSYCRFENTYRDLRDCYEAICDREKVEDDERDYRKQLIFLCREIVEEVEGDSEFE